MYDWRKLTSSERTELLRFRRQMSRPWHSPPHRPSPGLQRYIVTGTCYEHAPIIGHSHDRMEAFSNDLLQTIEPFIETLHAWCLLADGWLIADSRLCMPPLQPTDRLTLSPRCQIENGRGDSNPSDVHISQ